MQLTDQMKAEIDSINEYVCGMDPIRPLLLKEIYERRLTLNDQKYITENTKQLTSHKIRLEDLLCETDLKERIHLNPV